MYSSGVGSWAAAKRVAEKYGTDNLTLLFADTKDVYLHHEGKEQEFRKAIARDDIAILREQVNGIQSTVSLEEFRKRIESEPKQLNLFDSEALGGCGCFINE